MDNILNFLMESINLEIDPGITHEIGHVLKNRTEIEKYEIKCDDNIYRVTVKLNEYKISIVKDIFFALLRFICYKETFYTHQNNEDSYSYCIVSFSEGSGYCCQIKFIGEAN